MIYHCRTCADQILHHHAGKQRRNLVRGDRQIGAAIFESGEKAGEQGNYGPAGSKRLETKRRCWNWRRMHLINNLIKRD